MSIDYSAINKALAEKFGNGNMQLRKAGKDEPFHYVLWFKDDNTPASVIQEAKRIVGKFSPSHWHNDLMRHVPAWNHQEAAK